MSLKKTEGSYRLDGACSGCLVVRCRGTGPRSELVGCRAEVVRRAYVAAASPSSRALPRTLTPPARADPSARVPGSLSQISRRGTRPSCWIGSPRIAVETGIPELRGLTLQHLPYVLFFSEDSDAMRIHRLLRTSRDIPARGLGDDALHPIRSPSVTVPTVAREAARDMVRGREDLPGI